MTVSPVANPAPPQVPAEAVAGICPCVDLAAYDATAPAREADAEPDPKVG